MNNSTELALNITVTSQRIVLWYEHPECAVAPYGYAFYLAVKVFNFFMGLPSNLIVMWHIAWHRSKGSTSDLFIFYLALMDAFFCLMTPVELVNRLYLNDKGIWHIQNFAYGIKDTAPVFLTCICLDRYVAVVHPIVFTGIRDNRARHAVSAVVWALVLAFSITESIVGVIAVSDVFAGIILFAFFVMVFCNLSIIFVLRKSVAGKEVMTPVKKKAFKMVVIVLAIIIVNYLPAVALMPFGSAFKFVMFRCEIVTAVFSIMDLSCTIEPLVYLIKMDKLTCPCLNLCTNKPHNVDV
ncbi:P2Y purinoceptor 1-like [Trichomycterus rosablanca]|uniref:P2Y purinoceptor 1-like n=1 Tax=Trichomycterus rosablanca TaxID=2290929 RepID=UPI002F3595AC